MNVGANSHEIFDIGNKMMEIRLFKMASFTHTADMIQRNLTPKSFKRDTVNFLNDSATERLYFETNDTGDDE